jgi:hypothetical protein
MVARVCVCRGSSVCACVFARGGGSESAHSVQATCEARQPLSAAPLLSLPPRLAARAPRTWLACTRPNLRKPARATNALYASMRFTSPRWMEPTSGGSSESRPPPGPPPPPDARGVHVCVGAQGGATFAVCSVDTQREVVLRFTVHCKPKCNALRIKVRPLCTTPQADDPFGVETDTQRPHGTHAHPRTHLARRARLLPAGRLDPGLRRCPG